LQTIDAVLKEAEALVAPKTQKTTYLSGNVVMVDVQLLRLSADRAETFWSFSSDQTSELPRGYARNARECQRAGAAD